MSKDLASILKGWPAKGGMVRARRVTGDDGQDFIQLRLDLGLLQMALDGRPDGEHPFNRDSVLEELLRRVSLSTGAIELSPEDQEEITREMLQFYRRRISLMTLAEEAKEQGDLAEADACFRRAIRDADHNLAMIDVLVQHCTDKDFAEEHEQYRPFILMHRATCLAERSLLAGDADEAIEQIKAATRAIESWGGDETIETEEDVVEVSIFAETLRAVERRIRREYGLRRTLREQLDDAVAAEDF